MELSLTTNFLIYIVVSTIIMCLFLAYILKARLRSWNARLFLSYIISLAASFWVIYFIQKYLMTFTSKNLNPIKYISNIYWLFDIYIDYKLLEVVVISILLTLIFWFFMTNYLYEKKYLLIWTIIFSSYIIVGYWIAPLIITFLKSVISF
jgi:hypothetical protein